MADSKKVKRRSRENHPFAELPEEKVSEIAGAVEVKVYPPRTMIFRQGDPGNCFYTIRSGKVRVFRTDQDGVDADLSILGPGESFGEMALLTGEPRSACVETMEETRLAILSKEHFDRILKDLPQVAVGFVKKLSTWLVRDEVAIHREVQRQFKAPPVSWIDFLVITGVALLCGIVFNLLNPNRISPFSTSWSDEPIPTVAASMANTKQGEGTAMILDARPDNFFQKEHIKGAINIPWNSFDIVYLMELGEEPKAKEVIVYGRTISRLYDEQVARKLIVRGHKDVRILEGDLSAWKKQGYAVEP